MDFDAELLQSNKQQKWIVYTLVTTSKKKKRKEKKKLKARTLRGIIK